MDKVLSNVDLLYHIFQYLSFEEQLKLIKVCPQFQIAIFDVLWKYKYENIKVVQNVATSSVMLSLIGLIDNKLQIEDEMLKTFAEEKAILTNKDFEEFLPTTSSNIQIRELHILKWSPENSTSDLIYYNSSKFSNLTSITFNGINLTENSFAVLAINCPKLEQISLVDCKNSEGLPLTIGEDLQISTIQRFALLKCFKIKENKIDRSKRTQEKLLFNLNIKQIIIDVQKCYLPNGFDTYSQCEELTVGNIFLPPNFTKFLRTTLYSFFCLKKLTLSFVSLKVSIKEKFFVMLSQSCTKLEYLKLEKAKIKSFTPVYSLNALVLQSCTDLTWRNFEQILREMQLKSLSIIDTYFRGTFEYFNISTTLEHLHLSRLCSKEEKLFEMNGENLKNLTSLNFEFRFGEPFWINCPKLRTIKMYLNNGLFTKGLLEILKHPSIIYLTILSYDMRLNDFNASLENIKTNLLYLIIPFKLFLSNKTILFWLNLLNENPKLKIIMHDKVFTHFYLKELVEYIYRFDFPSHFKSIALCGVRVELKDIKENRAAVCQKIEQFVYDGAAIYISL